MISSLKYLARLATGDATLGPSGHSVVWLNGALRKLGEMLSATSQTIAKSSGVPHPRRMRYSTFSTQPVPSRHGVHLPHDSWE
jgi:hypothetical protein